MRKLSIACVAFMMISSVSAHATNIYLEGIGSYGSYGDAKSMPSGMLGFGVSVTDYVNVYARGFMGSSSSVVDATHTKKYGISGALGVIDYTYYLKSDFPLHVGFTASAGVGYASVNIKDDKTVETDGRYKSLSDSSPVLGAWGGVRILCTQSISLFAVGGYEYCVSFSDKLSERSVQGASFLFGVTLTVFGTNSPVTQGY